MIYYVNQNAACEGDGSKARPFKRIGDAARIAMPGDEVVVAKGVYREYVNPFRGGTKDARIVYRSEEPLGAVITGAEEVKGWKKYKRYKNVWTVRIPNGIFGDYNPYTTEVYGDWYFAPAVRHTGAVYLNDRMLYETESLEECIAGEVYTPSWEPQYSIYKWYSEQDGNETVLYANFQGADPNKENVEINVRRRCFFPEKTGRGYITVSGFNIQKAATTWAPPAAFQDGMVGPHWSKGWIIEDNVISNSKCVGVCLGKDRASGQNRWTIERTLSGFNRELEVIFQAEDMGWKKENIGSHIVRNNEIFDCEQAGIVGHLGCVFSIIENNYIHDINAKRQYAGAEVGCIKLHAAIDVIIRNNFLENGYNGLWLDWQGIGTRVTGNVFYNNDHTDLWTEVTHGPCLVDNNVMLSPNAFLEWGQGAAFVHNIVSGYITFHPVTERYTPYHAPHSTKIVGVMNFPGGDDRYYNNIFTIAPDSDLKDKDAGTSVYDERPPYYEGIYQDMMSRNPQNEKLKSFIEQMAAGNSQPARFNLAMRVGSNLYYDGVKHYAYEDDAVSSNLGTQIALEKQADKIVLKIRVDDAINRVKTPMVDTDFLGKTYYSNGYYENPDGTPLTVDHDFFGAPRGSNPKVGPFENLKPGMNEFTVWKF